MTEGEVIEAEVVESAKVWMVVYRIDDGVSG
jgi:hypothetical protein